MTSSRIRARICWGRGPHCCRPSFDISSIPHARSIAQHPHPPACAAEAGPTGATGARPTFEPLAAGTLIPGDAPPPPAPPAGGGGTRRRLMRWRPGGELDAQAAASRRLLQVGGTRGGPVTARAGAGQGAMGCRALWPRPPPPPRPSARPSLQDMMEAAAPAPEQPEGGDDEAAFVDEPAPGTETGERGEGAPEQPAGGARRLLHTTVTTLLACPSAALLPHPLLLCRCLLLQRITLSPQGSTCSGAPAPAAGHRALQPTQLLPPPLPPTRAPLCLPAEEAW
jgi:hypothetical protein